MGRAGRQGWWGAVLEDVDAALARDPAARSRLEVVLTYPGVHAVWAHRAAHALWHRPGLWLPARVLAHVSRTLTGIEIHPAATLGRRVFIDHGAGVVIGETAVVGDDVLLYHGATLGGRTGAVGVRHPRLGPGVVVGAGARLLGPIVVGAGAQVGANAVVVRDVPPGAVVVGVPGVVRPAAAPDGTKPGRPVT